jgi:hypothetical protein
MKRLTLLLSLTLPALLWTGCADHAPPLDPGATHPLAAAGGPHVVYVAPPIGDATTDRASILAALEEVRPGGTVQFAPGTYVIGLNILGSFAWIRATVPRITLVGHPDGTTLQGCDPAGGPIVSGGCMGLQLVGGHQTVRDLTFEHFNQPLVPGFFLFREPALHQVGGYRIENNIFRSSMWGVRMFGQWTQPTFVRHNTFLNVAFAVQMWGRTAHITDNDISAPDWEQVPTFLTGDVGVSLYSTDWLQTGPCDHNLVARNRIEHYVWGIEMWADAPGEGCRHNVIRDNSILNSQELVAFGIPAVGLWLENYLEPERLAHTLIQGNQIVSAAGAGAFLYRVAETRVINNTITDIVPSAPAASWFGEANGSGVWISPESHHNRILNTHFAAVEEAEVVLEGDRNHVATRSASDVVRDLGSGNRVTGPGSVVTTAAPAGASTAAANAAERVDAARMLREGRGVPTWGLERAWRVEPR